jgi:hypothetical protein
MKPQTKSIFVVIATLIIGMLLGALINGSIRSQIHDRVFNGPRQDRFGQMMERIIQPDSTQAEAIHELMDRYAPRFAEQHQRHTAEMKYLVDSLNEELAPILTEEQMARLMDRLNRFERGMRRPGQRQGPGQGMRPGMGPGQGPGPDPGMPPGGDPPPPPPDGGDL